MMGIFLRLSLTQSINFGFVQQLVLATQELSLRPKDAEARRKLQTRIEEAKEAVLVNLLDVFRDCEGDLAKAEDHHLTQQCNIVLTDYRAALLQASACYKDSLFLHVDDEDLAETSSLLRSPRDFFRRKKCHKSQK